jgi:hypothetical protein
MSSSNPTLPTNWSSLADRLNPSRPSFDPVLKASWKSLSKSERRKIIAADKKDIAALKTRGKTKLPFDAEDDDHCETSPVAYAHIRPMLTFIAERLGKSKAELLIYDPYYCAGATIGHLNKLGFNSVYNKAEDFYQVIQEGRVPPHDVLVTNPPYSGDHFDKLLKFLKGNEKPALLLLPEHFSRKSALFEADKYCFLSPTERYHYWTPEGRRLDKDQNDKKKAQHMNLVLGRRNSPFVSHWFINVEPVAKNDELISLVRSGKIHLDGCGMCQRQEDIKTTNFKGEVVASTDGVERGGDGNAGSKRKRSKKRKHSKVLKMLAE